MGEAVYSGAYKGFSFNNIHSATLGLVRVDQSGRNDLNLKMEGRDDWAVDVPGADGQYYFGGTTNSKTISVSFAFTRLRKEQIEFIKKWNEDKQPHDLILDETPFKKYSAKITSSMVINFLAENDGGIDYYYGEGEITFTCYGAYSLSRFMTLEEYQQSTQGDLLLFNEDITEYSDENSENTGSMIIDLSQIGGQFDWEFYLYGASLPDEMTVAPNGVAPSTLKGSVMTIDVDRSNEWSFGDDPPLPRESEIGWRKNSENKYSYKIKNTGDTDMPIQILVKLTASPSTLNIGDKFIITGYEESKAPSPFNRKGDEYILIDTGKQIVQGYDGDLQPTGRLYNQYVTKNELYKLPIGEETILNINLQQGESPVQNPNDYIKFYYNYRYIQ